MAIFHTMKQRRRIHLTSANKTIRLYSQSTIIQWNVLRTTTFISKVYCAMLLALNTFDVFDCVYKRN